jgi:hypothetical protein
MSGMRFSLRALFVLTTVIALSVWLATILQDVTSYGGGRLTRAEAEKAAGRHLNHWPDWEFQQPASADPS